MKEASSEANLTVVAIVLIGLIAGIATVIVNNMMSKTEKQAECMDVGQCVSADGKSCVDCSAKNKR